MTAALPITPVTRRSREYDRSLRAAPTFDGKDDSKLCQPIYRRELPLAERNNKRRDEPPPCTYMAVTPNGDLRGERELSADTPFFPQPKAADDSFTHDEYDGYDSCVGRVHY